MIFKRTWINIIVLCGLFYSLFLMILQLYYVNISAVIFIVFNCITFFGYLCYINWNRKIGLFTSAAILLFYVFYSALFLPEEPIFDISFVFKIIVIFYMFYCIYIMRWLHKDN